MSAELRKYAEGFSFVVPLIKFGVTDYVEFNEWAPVVADVNIIIDGVLLGEITTVPAFVAGANVQEWKFTLSDAEVTGKEIVVQLVDAAGDEVEDDSWRFLTFGHADAQYPFDFSLPLQDRIRPGPGVI